MWPGIIIAALIGLPQLAKAFMRRHEPEPANSRVKLPTMLLLLAACVTLAALGLEPAVFAVLALVCAVQIGFILTGRNPWWMQGAFDKREYPRQISAPPRDLGPGR